MSAYPNKFYASPEYGNAHEACAGAAIMRMVDTTPKIQNLQKEIE